MKAGHMVHVIEIQRSTATVNDAGTPERTWSRLATLRAEVVERSTEEFLRNAGETSETTIVFRTRFLAGLTDDDRVDFDGFAFDIDEIVTVGRRRGLELRCRRVAP
ncbi:Phage head-tail joining protein [Roseivivax jejudonensis]|uniref:Phage head-tail joining protein n=1 Tax=Roseivivax jejudonensis TaxID=1529041 RepID=A0A1X6YFJ6_9RHOB|nr:phage head closure protein [Roseivivax jejudonensis]SLN19961.1 Phage head-tail joining protein [Roseivivax jejudonensis]